MGRGRRAGQANELMVQTVTGNWPNPQAVYYGVAQPAVGLLAPLGARRASRELKSSIAAVGGADNGCRPVQVKAKSAWKICCSTFFC